ncbi:MAG: Abi family protein [Gallionella sp.]|nr:MAG: Abi family protein [Gallionella sp.]
MHIADCERAQHYLTHINYYRLRAYWLPFEIASSNDNDHAFQLGTDFDTVLAIYDFDRELRLLLLDAIERVEISLRTRWANVLALRYGPFAHEDSAHFYKPHIWQQCKDELAKEYARSRETFAEHYRTRYDHLNSPPIWVAAELMSLGHLSRWMQNLRIPKDRQAIADIYGLDERVLVSFAHHLTIVRNHCTHHGRVWNRKLSLKMQIPGKKTAGLSAMFNPAEDRRLYNTLTMLAFLMSCISPQSSWRDRLKFLIGTTPQVNPKDMGFPADWQQRGIWLECDAGGLLGEANAGSETEGK